MQAPQTEQLELQSHKTVPIYGNSDSLHPVENGKLWPSAAGRLQAEHLFHAPIQKGTVLPTLALTLGGLGTYLLSSTSPITLVLSSVPGPRGLAACASVCREHVCICVYSTPMWVCTTYV